MSVSPFKHRSCFWHFWAQKGPPGYVIFSEVVADCWLVHYSFLPYKLSTVELSRVVCFPIVV